MLIIDEIRNTKGEIRNFMPPHTYYPPIKNQCWVVSIIKRHDLILVKIYFSDKKVPPVISNYQ